VVVSQHNGGKFTYELGPVRDASVGANRMHRGELNFSHVKSTALLGHVVKLQPFAQTARFGCLEGLIERHRAMRVQVVEHQNTPSEIVHRTPFGHYQFTPLENGRLRFLFRSSCYLNIA
jgi:hypothetical protein